jgi:hypothetical protein
VRPRQRDMPFRGCFSVNDLASRRHTAALANIKRCSFLRNPLRRTSWPVRFSIRPKYQPYKRTLCWAQIARPSSPAQRGEMGRA